MDENMKILKREKLEEKAKYLRKLTLDMCCRLGVGHVTSAYSCTEIMVALFYGNIIRYNPNEPNWKDRDRFILSKGHASTILYPVLADLGYFKLEELENCLKPDALLGLLLKYSVPGAEISSGSLGVGFGVAAGIAYGAKLNRESYLTFAMLGDGECHEGAIWETAMFAAHNHLNNLIAIVDRNYLCCTDYTENLVSLEPFDEKWKAFGWDVKHINGHDFKQVFDALEGIRSRRSRNPLVIIADTVKGKGIDFISDIPLWHGAAPHGSDIERANICLEREGDFYE